MGLNVVELWADLNKKIKKLSGSIDPTLPGKVADIEAVIPSGASSENQLATAGDVNRIDLSIEQLSGSVLGIQAVIPSGASSENQLATESDIPDISQLTTDVSTIQGMIPSDASSSNKLVTKSDIDKGYVEVTADGVKTYRQLIDSLYTLLDLSKITKNSYVYAEEDNAYLYFQGLIGTGEGAYYAYTRVIYTGSATNVSGLYFRSTGSGYSRQYISSSSVSNINNSSVVPADGTKITLYY